jgi:hypothetical protein
VIAMYRSCRQSERANCKYGAGVVLISKLELSQLDVENTDLVVRGDSTLCMNVS